MPKKAYEVLETRTQESLCDMPIRIAETAKKAGSGVMIRLPKAWEGKRVIAFISEPTAVPQ